MEGKISLGFIIFTVRAHKDGRRKRIDNNNYLKWIDHNEKPTSWSYGNDRRNNDNVNVNEQYSTYQKVVIKYKCLVKIQDDSAWTKNKHIH